ncbi:hypothetical protein IAT38_007362 [Cryptococcus sp. DSM 104549]
MPDIPPTAQASSSALPPSSPPVPASTPPPAQTPTPNLSSPDTPHLAETPRTTHLQTPRAVFSGEAAPRERAHATEGEVRHGLGLGSASGSERGSVDMGPPEDRKGKGKAKAVDQNEAEKEKEDEDEEEELNVEDLQKFRRRLEEIESGKREGDGWAERDELIQMAKSLLSATDQLPLLEERLSAQKSTILTLQQQAKLSEKLSAMERISHAAEMQSVQADIRALLYKQESDIAAGLRPRKPLDLDVGYHKELEAANKRLEMDNRLMAPRLADTQRQIDRLVNELRLLRPHVMLNTEPLVVPKEEGRSRHSISYPHAPAPESYLPRQSEPSGSIPLPQYIPQLDKHRRLSRAAARTTMGDARAEHLLLASKKVRAMRHTDKRVGRLTLAELKRAGVPGPDGGLGYREGYDVRPESDAEDDEESEGEVPRMMLLHERRMSAAMASSASKVKESPAFSSTPLLPNRAKRGGKRPAAHPTPLPQTPSRQRMSGAPPSSLPQTTPGGSNFNDLLRAAEMATRPASPSDAVDGAPALQAPISTTRSTTTTHHSHSHSHSRGVARGRGDSDEERGSPKRPRRDTWGAAPGTPLVPGPPMPLISATPSSTQKSSSSALDLLAQASQLDMVSNERSPAKTADAPSSGSRGMLLDPASSPRSSMEDALGPAIDLTPRGGSGSFRPLAPAPGSGHGHGHGHGHGAHSRSAPGMGHAHRSSVSSHPPSGDDYPADLHTPKGRLRGSSPTSDSMYASSAAYPTPGRDSVFDDSRGEGSRDAAPAGSAGGGGAGEFASPSGKVVPGLGKYWHFTSEMPMKRVRSPYLKWTMEEDELLARAVAIHGEKWDLVSKGVPTRSYHQVRQRWLRKTGAFDTKKQQAKSELQDTGGSSNAGATQKTSALAQDE